MSLQAEAWHQGVDCPDYVFLVRAGVIVPGLLRENIQGSLFDRLDRPLDRVGVLAPGLRAERNQGSLLGLVDGVAGQRRKRLHPNP